MAEQAGTYSHRAWPQDAEDSSYGGCMSTGASPLLQAPISQVAYVM